MEKTIEMTQEFMIRAPHMDDLERATEMVRACELDEEGEAESTVDFLRAEWQYPTLNLATDGWLAVAPDGRFAGYALLLPGEKVRFRIDAYVHPDYTGLGIGTSLVRLAERRARQLVPDAPPGAQVVLHNMISHANPAARRLLEQEGFTPARHFLRMQIDMNGAPPEPIWHAGIAVRPFRRGQDEHAVLDAMNEAFRGHWGYIPLRFETWQHWLLEREDLDPGLWFLAVAGDDILGFALCFARPTEGWVQELGVRGPWRRRGLGLALLRHAFREFFRRGQRRVSLGVDSQNTTGATRLYRRAGMRVAYQLDTYQKILRPGREIGAGDQA
jgi:mycothiol synthase